MEIQAGTVRLGRTFIMKLSSDLNQTMARFHQLLDVQTNFDIVYHTLTIGGKQALIYFVDGLTKDEVLLRIMQGFASIQPDDMPDSPHGFSKKYVPYGETGLEDEESQILVSLLSGLSCLLIDGYDKCITIDCRTYPARGVEEPEKDKVLRGSRDGFVETLIFNTALIRRRIRDVDFTVEITQAGERSHTDIAICYMKGRVDQELLKTIKERIQNLQVDALTMNQESLAECLLPKQWLNPLPRIRFTERPDTASASILEGNLIVLTDNTPSAMILPTHFFDFFQEANDYYFPPLIGTYLKLVRIVIFFLTLFFTPCWYLALRCPGLLPDSLHFILIEETAAIPVLAQLLIIEVMIDGLRLASLNTPSSLSSAFSILGAVILGEYAVSTGWFNGEVILYMAFVALSNYAQPSFELGYSFKFFRMSLLILIALLGSWGLLIGTAAIIVLMLKTDTLSGNYCYPLYPYDGTKLRSLLLRKPADHRHGNSKH